MDKKAIAAAIGAVVLTAGAGATAWATVFDQQTPPTGAEPVVTTVYVDQFGNAVDPAALIEQVTPTVEEVPVTAPTPAFEETEYASANHEEEHDAEETDHDDGEGHDDHEEGEYEHEDHDDEYEHEPTDV